MLSVQVSVICNMATCAVVVGEGLYTIACALSERARECHGQSATWPVCHLTGLLAQWSRQCHTPDLETPIVPVAHCFLFNVPSAASVVPHASKGASLVAPEPQLIMQSLLPKLPICALCQGARDARALHLFRGCRALQSVQASVTKLH